MTEAVGGLSRRQVLGGMVGAAAVGAVFTGLDAAGTSTVSGSALAGDADIDLGPVTRPLCSADWAAVCWQTPPTSV